MFITNNTSSTPDNSTITPETNVEPLFLGVGVDTGAGEGVNMAVDVCADVDVGGGVNKGVDMCVDMDVGGGVDKCVDVGTDVDCFPANKFPTLQFPPSQHFALQSPVYPDACAERHTPICPLL